MPGGRHTRVFALPLRRSHMTELIAVIVAFAALGAVALLLAETQGRSGPAAAVGFYLGGPVLGVLLVLPLGIHDGEPSIDRSPELGIYGVSPSTFVLLTIASGLVAAAVASLGYLATTLVRLPPIESDPVQRPPFPVPSAAMKFFGLGPGASLDDVNGAYATRRAELEARGARSAELRRLQLTYERAIVFLATFSLLPREAC
jgi:hypothetical protein